MREALRDAGRLEHILMSIGLIEEFTRDMTYEQFVVDKRTLFATIYNIQILGEASYKLTKEFKAAHPELPWSLMEKMRHVLVHDYYNIVPEAVWDVVTEDIPSIKPLLQRLADENKIE
ncbi:MAG: DUF86 domain-containing protein [Bacteroidales bacterium]|jgi:uncharacterized protein with HEPN domain|nr:DUF86 domain-containing protein [Bacteroidales bacterium]